MTLVCHQIIPGKANALAIVLIVSTSVTSSAVAQILPPLAEGLIAESGDGISIFSLGYGVGVANYMCFESLKGNLAKSEGDEILAQYKLWFGNQDSYQFNVFVKRYILEMESFNQTFRNHDCNFSF